jgi:hypothetical protein
VLQGGVTRGVTRGVTSVLPATALIEPATGAVSATLTELPV